jgi:hypothetical protein
MGFPAAARASQQGKEVINNHRRLPWWVLCFGSSVAECSGLNNHEFVESYHETANDSSYDLPAGVIQSDATT